MKPILLILVVSFFILSGCSSSKTDQNDPNLKIISQKMDSWVNLMPGSKPFFFISGSLIIENKEGALLDSVHLLKCEVFQKGKLLYVLHPDLRISDNNKDIVNAAGKMLLIKLSPGTPIKKELNLEQPISMDIYLAANNRIFQYRIDNIIVTKAY